MAAPLVAGSAAIIIEEMKNQFQYYDPFVIKNILMSTATDLHNDPFTQGSGLANIESALNYVHGENGVFIFEDPYLGEIIEKTSFDQIYDEHVFLFSAHSVRNLAAMHGLELINVEPQITHGGSMRYTLAHKDRKIVSQSVLDLINHEKEIGPVSYTHLTLPTKRIV